MAGQMFGEVSNPTIQIGAQKWYTVPVSILAHVGAIAAVVIVPLLAAQTLPGVPSMMAFVAAPPPRRSWWMDECSFAPARTGSSPSTRKPVENSGPSTPRTGRRG